MYRNFFGFSERPFDLTPDPKFLYLSRVHIEALASLTYGIHERRGLIVIVGEVGTGKTLLLNAALDRLDENTRVAHIFNTDLTFNQMLHMALVELGLARPDETLTKVEALHRLNNFAIKQLPWGRNVALIVDEAQNLDRSCMENLRLLSNLETHKHKLVQIVLSGQPELDTKLNQPELRQLAQRISLRRYIAPLSEQETYEYIQHRLTIANYRGSSLFSPRAQQLIWQYSGGIPRKINILCDNALLIGYGLRKNIIKAPVVEEAINDLSWSPFLGTTETRATTPMDMHAPQLDKRASRPRFALIGSSVIAACLILTVWLFLGNSDHKTQKGPSPPFRNATRLKIPRDLSNPDQSPVSVQPVHYAKPAIAREASAQKKWNISFAQGTAPQQKPEDKMTSTPAHVSESKTEATKAGNLIIQVGAFRERLTAEGLMRRLQEKGYDAYLAPRTLKNLGLVNLVRLRGYASENAARTVIAQLEKEEKLDDSFIVNPGGN